MSLCGGRDQVAKKLAASAWHGFEYPMPLYFAHAVKDAGAGLVIDVGANTGYYSLLALAVSGAITIAAYEPMTMVHKILSQNIALNKFRQRVSLFPYAASNASGKRMLFIPHDRHGLIETSASLSSVFKNEFASQQPVTTKVLDVMHGRGKRVVVIKVDAESHDFEVLCGAEGIMKRDRPVVFLEVLRGADEQGLTQLLNRCDYQDFVLRPDGASAAGDTVAYQPGAWNHMWVPREKNPPLAHV